MRNVCASNRMGTWSTSPSHRHLQPTDAVERYTTAKSVVEQLRGEVQPRVDRAGAAGFDVREMLRIPEIRQSLACAKSAVGELRSARADLRSARALPAS